MSYSSDWASSSGDKGAVEGIGRRGAVDSVGSIARGG